MIEVILWVFLHAEWVSISRLAVSLRMHGDGDGDGDTDDDVDDDEYVRTGGSELPVTRVINHTRHHTTTTRFFWH